MWNGSAAFRAVVPAFISTVLVVVYWTHWKEELEQGVEDTTTVSVMIGFFGFLLTTRLNFSYGRWWEAATMSHQMTSKLTDSALCLAAFHYQSSAMWEDIKPQTFGEAYANVRDEVDQNGSSHTSKDPPAAKDEVDGSQALEVATLEGTTGGDDNDDDGGGGFFRWFQQTVIDPIVSTYKPSDETIKPSNQKMKNSDRNTAPRKKNRRSKSEPILVVTKSFQPNQKQVVTQTAGSYSVRFASQRAAVMKNFCPSDFLEEAVHLYSLLNAVAMASLRHDVEGCPSPLTEYIPNQPFPPYNPDQYHDRYGYLMLPSEKDNTNSGPYQQWWQTKSDQVWNLIYFLAGINRSPKQRTLYNAARPFHVLGGVSEVEARRLQLARGPMAQVALCQLWLKEFVAREYLHGSTGDVGSPIVGRVLHFLADGMTAYHQCRKIAFVPFPFPHEQMTSLFTMVVVFVFPVLYVAFVNNLTLACALNFTNMLCFQGIYEVARELSNPYHTIPNDLPLNRFHAQFNESLRALMTGYHPDAKTKQQQQQEEEEKGASCTSSSR